MCKTCEKAVENLRNSSAYDRNLYPAMQHKNQAGVRNPQVIRILAHSPSMLLPTAKSPVLPQLIQQFSTLYTGPINTITNT